MSRWDTSIRDEDSPEMSFKKKATSSELVNATEQDDNGGFRRIPGEGTGQGEGGSFGFGGRGRGGFTPR